ncbi:ArsR/SmtB family transcription factor [Microbacterium sp. I2]|jgi:DNA-binding transcriptional ArsR family regulator|uniref:ArsR/SmtB family transcription factor n=1 Tax=Microbacterium sp. I2 TaxID=3391826 RepID=UPI003EDB38FB
MAATDRLSVVFSALADPTRRDILTRLSTGPVTVGTLAANYTISRPAISQHLGVLESAGLVARTVNAQWREVTLKDDGLDDASEWIAKQRAHWTENFDLLEERLRERRTTKGSES